MTSKRLYNFPKGTKVITPIAGFPTTINPIFQVGFEPVFVDIDLDTLNLNLDQVEEKAKEGCKIITFAHVLGNPPNMDRLMQIVEKYGLILLEDCCDALGSTYDGKELGSFGELASCSFYPAHHITMGEWEIYNNTCFVTSIGNDDTQWLFHSAQHDADTSVLICVITF
jgi:CDP-6-deoxy-D-xylo-4-hexulose-3-dehydrase